MVSGVVDPGAKGFAWGVEPLVAATTDFMTADKIRADKIRTDKIRVAPAGC
jgi:hypothetical protein